jgi:hypothetical protein
MKINLYSGFEFGDQKIHGKEYDVHRTHFCTDEKGTSKEDF